MNDRPHIPVMLPEVLEALKPIDGEIYIDGTFGAGGYTSAILDHADCNVIGIDRDPTAIENGQKLVEKYSPRPETRRKLNGRILDFHSTHSQRDMRLCDACRCGICAGCRADLARWSDPDRRDLAQL